MTHSQKSMLEEIERRNYSQSTTHTYLSAIADLGRYFARPPEELTPEHIREYQVHLFRDRHLAANTVAQRVGALRFFYTKVLKRGWSVAETPYPKKPQQLPVILSPEEVTRLIEHAQTPFHRTILMTLYATGMRRAELAHPRRSRGVTRLRSFRVTHSKISICGAYAGLVGPSLSSAPKARRRAK